MADPTHRVKTVAKYFYALAAMPKKESAVKKSHAERLKKYWGYFIKQQRYNSLDDMRRASKAPLNHLFGDHEYCNDSCCVAKKIKEKGLKYVSKDGPFLDKEKDHKTYQQLKEVCDRFSTDEKLKQSLHPGHTQMNESFNNMLSYIAPKNVNFSQSNSLSYRFALCIALYNEGFYETWSSVYEKMGRKMRSNFVRYFMKKDKRKVTKRKISSTPEFKRRRRHRSNAMIFQGILEQHRIEKNSLGDYGSGIGIEISKLDKSNAKSQSNEQRSRPKCKACGSITHCLTSHRDCPFNAKKKEERKCKIVPSKSKQYERKEWIEKFHHKLNDTNESNQVAFNMMNLSRSEIESCKPIGESEDLKYDETSIRIKQSHHNLCSKKKDENESYSGELCQIIDNSENEFTYSENENITYDLNDTYETMIEFETLREMCMRICTMTIHD